MGYKDKNTALTQPLSVHDVAHCLGATVLDVGYLCQHSDINAWSFYKPIEVPTPQALTDAQRYEADGGFINCATMVGTLQAVNNIYSEGVAWEYARPRTWFRLTDFVGYRHTAHDTTPTGAITAPNGRASAVLSMNWSDELAQHIARFKTITGASTDGRGFGLVGVFLRIGTALYFAYLGTLSESPTSCALALDTLLASSPAFGSSLPVLAMPVLMDYGKGNSAGAVLLKNRLYTADELNKSLQYSPYKFVALPGVPFIGTYTPIAFRVWEGLTVMVAWSTGGYVGGTAAFNGQVFVLNDNAFDVDVSLFVTGNGNTGAVKLYGDYDAPTYTKLYEGDRLVADIARSWTPADASATVRFGLRAKFLLDGATVEASADFAWSKTAGAREQVKQGTFAEFIENKIILD